jgi:hypothetical protein
MTSTGVYTVKKILSLALLGSAIVTTAIASVAQARMYFDPFVGYIWEREVSGFAKNQHPVRPKPGTNLNNLSQANADTACLKYVFRKKGEGFAFRDLQRGYELKLLPSVDHYVWAHRAKNVCVVERVQPNEITWRPARVVNP